MGLRVAVWAIGLTADDLSGPWIALNRLLTAYGQSSRRHELVLYSPSETIDRPVARQFECRQAIKLPILLERAYCLEGCDLVLTNGIPSTVGSLLLHSYVDLPNLIWVHGTLAFVEEYRLDRPVERSAGVSVRRRWKQGVMRSGARRAHRLIASSGFTRRVLEESIGSGDFPTEVIPYGVDHDRFRPADPERIRRVQERFCLPEEFMLTPAVAHERKNIPGILTTFAKAAQEIEEAHLVITGKGWSDDLIAEWIDSPMVRRRIHALGFVDEADLAGLYSVAKMLLFPTLHEHFGLPLVEGMASGCPVISSDGTAVPEVCGGAGILVDDPRDIDAIADVVKRVWRDEGLRQRMREAGIRRAAEFSWERSADRFEELLDRTERILRST